MRLAPALTVALLASGCGATTALDIPPAPPCETPEPNVPRPARCDRVLLGPPIALTDEPAPGALRTVDTLDAASISEGARVVLQVRDEARGRVEVQALTLDASGRARAAAEPIVGLPALAGTSLTEPSALGWGCGDAVLAGLSSTAASGPTRSECALRIQDGGRTRRVAIASSEACADLAWDGEALSLLASWPGERLALVHVSLEGELERTSLELPASGETSWSIDRRWRRAPSGPGAWLWTVARNPSGGALLPLDASGRFGTPIELTSRVLFDVRWAVDDAGRRWIVWAESESAADRGRREDVRMAQLDAEGRIAEPVAVEIPAGALLSSTDSRALWLADRLALAVHDPLADETSIVLVDSAGRAHERLSLGSGRTTELVAAPGGALVLHAEARTVERAGLTVTLGEVLVSRTLACE